MTRNYPARRTPKRGLSTTVVVLILLAVAAYYAWSQFAQPSAEADGDSPVIASPISTASAQEALDLLDELPVKGKSPLTGYDREGKFGSSWTDVDDNGCDTRNDMLQRDLVEFRTEGECKVMTGILVSPYTNETIDFVRGVDTSAEVQIDHVVALANAWQTGAQKISQERRIALANDPLNLFAVDGTSNSQKSASDASAWLPKSKTFRCIYVAHQVEVKEKYDLWVTKSEHDAIERVLENCV